MKFLFTRYFSSFLGYSSSGPILTNFNMCKSLRTENVSYTFRCFKWDLLIVMVIVLEHFHLNLDWYTLIFIRLKTQFLLHQRKLTKMTSWSHLVMQMFFLAIVQMYYCKLRFSCKFITSRNIHEYQLRYCPSEKHFHRWKLFLNFAKKLKKRNDK